MSIKDKAIETGTIDGHEYFVVPGPAMEHGMGGLNGYVIFPKRPVREQGYNGILTYVPVHGGITYAEEKDGGMVYGFDTAHSHSEQMPLTDPVWIKGQCEIMLRGLLKAAEVEGKYLRCISNRGRAKWAQIVLDIQPDEEPNLGTMLNVLGGKL